MGEMTIPITTPSAADLRKVSAAERSAILEAQAAIAESFYTQDVELTAFEAFDEDDKHGDQCEPAAG